MGFYIERTSKGTPLPKDKFMALLADGGEEIKNVPHGTAPEWTPDLVCVIYNGVAFQAAGYAYCKEEAKSFAWTGEGRDNRERRWMRYPHVREALHSAAAYDMLRQDYPNG